MSRGGSSPLVRPLAVLGLVIGICLTLVAAFGRFDRLAESAAVVESAAADVASVAEPSVAGSVPAGDESPWGVWSSQAIAPLKVGAVGEASEPQRLPGGHTQVFEDGAFLVAYYGTAQTSALGVLGERSPAANMPRLMREARKFRRPGTRIQPVFELIVTVADAYPGRDGDFNHDIPRRYVQQFIEAAHKHGALLTLDIQPGRSTFPNVAKRWEWALRDPWVGLALDPEWRMGRREVPGQVIGSVSAAEINATSAWLASLTKREGLPQKVFMLHQFRTDMIRDLHRVAPRSALALVQHVDGFGPPGAKLGTYHTVARPQRFTMGFKLFYDEDRPRMSAAAVLGVRPRVRFVSFQ